MEPVEVFLQFSASALKATILKSFYYRRNISLQDFQMIYHKMPHQATACLWELCNEGLIQRNDLAFQLTELGQEYVAILEELALWQEKQQLNGGISRDSRNNDLFSK